ncbi:MAG: YkgJ family cysteine cluster protein [Phycisphaerales bacterium]|nr:MAG: YkgJ family cysteine cluster protein [Phycisphaerales bacterium]
MVNNKTPWYVAGLHFECNQCGGCCSGPGEGYIWVTRQEIEFIADHLNMTVEQLRQRFTRHVGLRRTIIEEPATRDCIFLKECVGQKGCAIYPVRPSQCRSWPFWPENLKSPGAWSQAARKCPGINRGRLYSFDQIERIRRCKKWWQETGTTAGCSKK